MQRVGTSIASVVVGCCLVLAVGCAPPTIAASRTGNEVYLAQSSTLKVCSGDALETTCKTREFDVSSPVDLVLVGDSQLFATDGSTLYRCDAKDGSCRSIPTTLGNIQRVATGRGGTQIYAVSRNGSIARCSLQGDCTRIR